MISPRGMSGYASAAAAYELAQRRGMGAFSLSNLTPTQEELYGGAALVVASMFMREGSGTKKIAVLAGVALAAYGIYKSGWLQALLANLQGMPSAPGATPSTPSGSPSPANLRALLASLGVPASKIDLVMARADARQAAGDNLQNAITKAIIDSENSNFCRYGDGTIDVCGNTNSPHGDQQGGPIFGPSSPLDASVANPFGTSGGIPGGPGLILRK